MKKFDKLKLIIFIGIVGFVSAVIYHYVLAMYLNLPWPHNSFLFTSADKFMNFYHAWILGRDILAGRNPYLNAFACIYFPFAISMKLYPAVLLILIISDKRYKEAIRPHPSQNSRSNYYPHMHGHQLCGASKVFV